MILRLDGQDHYDTTYFPPKYTTVDSTRLVWTVVAEGPNGKNCLKRTATATGNTGYLEMAPFVTQAGPWSPTSSGLFGFKIKVNNLASIDNPLGPGNPANSLVEVMNGGDPHIALQLNPNGTFTLIRAGFGGVTLAISSEGLKDQEWANVEFMWNINDTTGGATVRVNGTQVLDVQNVGTKNAVALAKWNSVIWGRVSSAATSLLIRLADWFLADLTGGAFDVKTFTPKGVWEFVVIRPNGVGASSGWTPSSGANWQNVDETPPNGDTDYISTTAIGTRDTYQFEDIPTNATVIAFQTVILPRLEADGTAGITPVFRQGGTDFDAATSQGFSQTGYDTYKMQAYDTNPATGVKATPAEINAAQFGLVKSA